MAQPAIAGEEDSPPAAGQAAVPAANWQLEDLAPSGARGYEVVEPTLSGDVVALYEGEVIRCWDGTRWNDLPVPAVPEDAGRLYGGVGGVSCSDLYLFDRQDEPRRWHWDGESWDSAPSGTTYAVDTVRAFAEDDIWAFDSIVNEAAHFDGTDWQKVSLPDVVADAVVGTTGDDFWVLGNAKSDYGTQVAYRWNGTAFTKGTLPAAYEGYVHEAVTVSAGEAYVFGTHTEDGYLYWNGTAWQHRTMAGVDDYVHGTAYAAGTLWVGGYDRFLRLDDGAWSVEEFPEIDNPDGQKITDLAADPRSDSVFAGGFQGHPEMNRNRVPLIYRSHVTG
ncbi:hypothetical protein LHJ74_04825 [Streptomyces sp. N2-109]|uniref:Uncharacterized protein n=1 Tax=Streptomyces gossypii TaxID=2883101 RepID=A0ABT2JN03_9ACTN|nr:hypothetical protein [Streptomyces gossypii]MCT2589262.1 hypothetical protein [Streptomyces gossypii]